MVSGEEPATVHVRFSDADAARRALETRWHPSQREQVLHDGSVDMWFEVAGLLEITPWILSWGDTVEVLEPLELRQRVSAVAMAMARLDSRKMAPGQVVFDSRVCHPGFVEERAEEEQ